jgi:hypothetical protein
VRSVLCANGPINTGLRKYKKRRESSMDRKTAYKDFTRRLKLLISKNPDLIKTTLSNIFTMRIIGNKTHGDLAEIGISEFINQYMYDFRSIHVGKDLYRAKEYEEDIKITDEINKVDFPVSLKAYGVGPLQLSTDKNFLMFPFLQNHGEAIRERETILAIMNDPAFDNFMNINVLPLIYDEKKKRCNILVFDYERAKESVRKIEYERQGRGRKHPVYRFYDDVGDYVCEVRYGGPAANALQRGLWTHTKNALKYFDTLTNGWIDYSDNRVLVELFAHALVATVKGHSSALERIKEDIEQQNRLCGLS